MPSSRLRAARRTIAIAGLLVVCLALHWLSRAVGGPSPWPRRFLGTLARFAGFDPVPAFNPYWDENGRTFEDPDGYRVVLAHTAWNA